MNNSFLSLVLVLDEENEWKQLPENLKRHHTALQQFSHWEIILVNNTDKRSFEAIFNQLPEALRSGIYLINLARKTDKNHAVLAGLDRANGDYTVILDTTFSSLLSQNGTRVQSGEKNKKSKAEHPILPLYRKAREGYDIVYLQAPHRRASFLQKILYANFYHIMRKYSDLEIDPLAHDTRIISRRALNALLRLREKMPFMKAIYSLVGYRATALPTDIPLDRRQQPLKKQLHDSLLTIISYTHFLRSMLLRIFLFATAFLLLVVANALSVKTMGIDLLGNPQEAVSGWTFLVVLISAFFAMTFLILYIMSIYLSNIYQEMKQRPLYVVESFQRV